METIGGDVSYSLRDQMISYWVQPVDHNIRDVTVLFIQLRIQQRIWRYLLLLFVFNLYTRPWFIGKQDFQKVKFFFQMWIFMLILQSLPVVPSMHWDHYIFMQFPKFLLWWQLGFNLVMLLPTCCLRKAK